MYLKTRFPYYVAKREDVTGVRIGTHYFTFLFCVLCAF
jgi:hypothetical protein